MKKFLLFYLITIVILVSGFHLAERDISVLGREYSVEVKDCADSDNDSIYVEGKIDIYYVSGSEEHFRDYCNGNNLFEYGCFENKPRSPKVVRCKTTCHRGRCFDTYNTSFSAKPYFAVTREEAREAYFERKEEEEIKELYNFSQGILKLKNKYSTDVDSCSETDDGLDRYSMGDIEIKYVGGEREYLRDICRGQTLFEYQCDAETPRKPAILRCKLGCRNGVCVDKYVPAKALVSGGKGFMPQRLTKKEAEELPQFLKSIYYIQPQVTPTKEEEAARLRKDYVASCNETDNGSIYVAGRLELRYPSGESIRFFEKCSDRNYVLEYSCSNQYPRTPVNIRCPLGCVSGACVKKY